MNSLILVMDDSMIEMVKIEPPAFRYWCIMMTKGENEHNVYSYYGTLGKPLSELNESVKVFNNYWNARDYVYSKIDEKRRHGYKVLTDEQSKLLEKVRDTKSTDDLILFLKSLTKNEVKTDFGNYVGVRA